MEFTAWGRYPSIPADAHFPEDEQSIDRLLRDIDSDSIISRGLGRSYGDSSLSDTMVFTRYLDSFDRFDRESGVLVCAAGVSLAEILNVIVPVGWFLPVTPGTKFVTVGGAIASDVHGKNHHLEGSFSSHVQSLKIATANAGIVECSSTANPELFKATCGGMGLTGIITEATIQLKKINSNSINQSISCARNLEEIFQLFEVNRDCTYSVAWIDCLGKNDSLGRSILIAGEHGETELKKEPGASLLNLPFNMPKFLLNRYTVAAFNNCYYWKHRNFRTRELTHYNPFFYPLDSIDNWNRLYGRDGFTQYQFVLPKENGFDSMSEILRRISSSGKGSFLAVLKAFGAGNDNYLSFPIEGYTLALDLKLEPDLFPLLNSLDEIVLAAGGRVYLTKDVRLSKEVFRKCYPHWEKFAEVREHYGATRRFNSLQSRRLGL